MRKSVLLGGALAFAAGAAHAEDVLGLYVGAGAIQNKVEGVGGSSVDVDLYNKQWKAFAGIKPGASPLGFEAEYLNFGSATTATAHASADAWAFDAIGHVPMPLPFLSIYGKAGVSRIEASGSVTVPGISLRFSDQQSQFTYGAGVQVQVQGLGARLEYEHFNLSNTDGVNVFTVGVLFRFM
jgi:opacity protein-like surface antigen